MVLQALVKILNKIFGAQINLSFFFADGESETALHTEVWQKQHW